MSRPLIAVAAAAVLAVSLAGCGSDSEATDKADTLSAADFKAQANALCKASDEELEELDETLSEDATMEEVEAYLETGVAKTRALADDIEALEEPSDLTAGVDAMLASVRAAADLIEEKGVDLLSEQEDPFEDANKKASDLGLDDCAD